MDDGIGEILYILAMVAFFIFSAIVKSKKKKQQIPSSPVDDQEEPTFSPEDDFKELREIFQPQKTSSPEYEEAKRVEKVPVVKPVFEKEDLTHSYKKQDQPFGREQLIVDLEDTSTSYWDDTEFDLKNAVVFSEILKRPDY